MSKPLVLIVDDELDQFPAEWLDGLSSLGELIKASSTTKFRDARSLITNHPEADIILLDGFFTDGDCEMVIGAVPKESRNKVFVLVPKGTRGLIDCGQRESATFPGKTLTD